MRRNGSASSGNILLVANYDSGVGYAWWLMENFWVAIARHFAARGRRCVLAYPKITEVPASIAGAPIELVEHDFADRSRGGLARVRALIRNHRITSVYLTDRPYYSGLYALLRLAGVRRIVLHDHTPGERPAAPFAKCLLKRLLFSTRFVSCDAYIGVSRFVYNRMIENACAPPGRCTYVLNGIEPIDRQSEWRHYANAQFGIPRGSVIVVSTGRATRYKGIDFLVRCADEIVNQHRRSSVYFLHCGSGPDLAEFRQLATGFGLGEHFVFAGQRPDVRQILQSCDVAMQASRGEAFSLSILEYLSAGLATLVPDNCGNGEAVVESETGMLYQPGNLSQAVARLLRLVDDAGLRESLGQRASASVRERFTIQRANADLLAILDRTL